MQYIVLVSLFMTTLSSGIAFLTTPESCPAPPPCTCSIATWRVLVQCDSKQLTQIPNFTKISHSGILQTVTIYLWNNRFNDIPAHAFKNLSVLMSEDFKISLEDNNISQIDPAAFDGVENLTSLDLSMNKLQQIPRAVTELNNLKSLNLQYNPISTFHDAALKTLGRSLLEFRFGSSVMKTWPSGVRFLHKLQTLYISSFSVSNMPLDAFHAFEKTLHSLQFFHSFEHVLVSDSVCSISDLHKLSLVSGTTGSKNTTSILPSCRNPLENVTDISLNGYNLTSFPSLFRFSPKVARISVVYSMLLHDIDVNVIPSENNVIYFSLSGDGFESVPAALLKFKHLESLILRKNKITYINATDLNFTKLQYLDLSDNPIQTISNSAFNNLPSLTNLYLESTRLKTVPTAISNFGHLLDLSLDGSPIECTCDLWWMRAWSANSSVAISGTCEASTNHISNFVRANVVPCSTQG